MITKDDKLMRLLCQFQYWIGTHYNNLPTDSGNMTERSRRFLKENEQAFSLFDVVGRSEQLKAVEKLKDFAYEVCPLHREDDLEEIVGSL